MKTSLEELLFLGNKVLLRVLSRKVTEETVPLVKRVLARSQETRLGSSHIAVILFKILNQSLPF